MKICEYKVITRNNDDTDHWRICASLGHIREMSFCWDHVDLFTMGYKMQMAHTRKSIVWGLIRYKDVLPV